MGGRELGACPAEPGQEEHSSRWVLPIGGHCSGHRPCEASKKRLRARAPEQTEYVQLKRQSWEWTPRDRQAGPHSGPLDLMGSPGHCHCLWTCWGPGARPEPGPDDNIKKHLLILGPLRDTLALCCPPPPRQVAGPEHPWQALAASHRTLPGRDLARCGPAQAQEAEGPEPPPQGHGPWLVAA